MTRYNLLVGMVLKPEHMGSYTLIKWMGGLASGSIMYPLSIMYPKALATSYHRGPGSIVMD